MLDLPWSSSLPTVALALGALWMLSTVPTVDVKRQVTFLLRRHDKEGHHFEVLTRSAHYRLRDNPHPVHTFYTCFNVPVPGRELHEYSYNCLFRHSSNQRQVIALLTVGLTNIARAALMH